MTAQQTQFEDKLRVAQEESTGQIKELQGALQGSETSRVQLEAERDSLAVEKVAMRA